MPVEYYTNMISLTADINITLLLLANRFPRLLAHLNALHFELPMVLVELLITMFTANKTEISDIIMDAVLLEGTTVYYKVVLIFMEYFEEELMQRDDFSRVLLIQRPCLCLLRRSSKRTFRILIISNLICVVFFLTSKMCSKARFLLGEIRDIFTEKERQVYRDRMKENSKIPSYCYHGDSCVCLKVLSMTTLRADRAKCSVFTTKGLLNNFKADHFSLSRISTSSELRRVASLGSDSRSQNDFNKIMKSLQVINKRRLQRNLYGNCAEDGDLGGNENGRKINNRYEEIEPMEVICSESIYPYDSEDVLIERNFHTCDFKVDLSEKIVRVYLARKDILDSVALDNKKHKEVVEILTSCQSQFADDDKKIDNDSPPTESQTPVEPNTKSRKDYNNLNQKEGPKGLGNFQYSGDEEDQTYNNLPNTQYNDKSQQGEGVTSANAKTKSVLPPSIRNRSSVDEIEIPKNQESIQGLAQAKNSTSKEGVDTATDPLPLEMYELSMANNPDINAYNILTMAENRLSQVMQSPTQRKNPNSPQKP